jgi:hypothetical protein
MVKRQREDDVVCNPSASITLEDGDHITVVAGIVVEWVTQHHLIPIESNTVSRVRWRRIACFVPPARGMPLFSSEDCASIGSCHL